MENRRPRLREGGEGGDVQGPRPLASPEHEHDGAVRRKPETRPRLGASRRARTCRDRAPDHPVLRSFPPLERESAKDALCEGQSEPVGKAELGVRLEERRRDPEGSRGQDHGAADVPTGPEHGAGPPPPEDPNACGRCREVARKRAGEPQADAARQAFHPEVVELEAGGARQPLLD